MPNKPDIFDVVAKKNGDIFTRVLFQKKKPEVLPNIPSLIAAELSKLPPRIIEKVLEKETVIKEVTKKDNKKYADEESLIKLQGKIKELEDMIERLKRFAIHGGSGVIGLPNAEGHGGQFLTTDGNRPSWGTVTSNGGASANPFYIGDPLTNGSWRFFNDGTNLSVQRLEGGIWNEKSSFLS